jgi:hypothetical protein
MGNTGALVNFSSWKPPEKNTPYPEIMKRYVLLIPVALLSLTLYSQENGLGLGIIIGEPTGISAKLWTAERTALDAAVAWSFAATGYMRVHADLIWHNFSLDVAQGKLPLYYGLGAKLLLSSELGLGIRIPLGIAYLFESVPVEAFAELVPGLNLLPEAGFGLDAAIGVRYYL